MCDNHNYASMKNHWQRIGDVTNNYDVSYSNIFLSLHLIIWSHCQMQCSFNKLFNDDESAKQLDNVYDSSVELLAT